MGILAPSILAADLSNLAQQIRLAELGGADWIHCDIMDGHFVPNITFGPIIVKAAHKSTKLPLDVHLMIEHPEKYIEQFAEAGASSITVHQEAVIHLNRTVQHLKELNVKAGVSINPSTPIYTLRDVAEYIDMVLIMSVNPGFGGQTFISNSLRRVRETVKLREEMNANFLIEIDGGIDRDTIKSAQDAGCDVFVAGSAVFHSDNVTAAALELKNLISGK